MTRTADGYNRLVLGKFVHALCQVANMDMKRAGNISFTPLIRTAYIQDYKWLLARPAFVECLQIAAFELARR